MNAVSNEPHLTDFDTSSALSAVEEVAGDGLRAFVEYDDETYNLLYIAERVVQEFGDEATLEEFADRLHYNYKLDFNEREMYADLYGPLGELAAFAVYLDDETLVRYVGEREGIYVSVEPDVSANGVVDALTETAEADR
ncbi:hypothetical protein [Halorussus salinus]|uniref:hypothetical protein n=1 Tax=Halorussus salinus TaxID=1364935 RepID=UPI001091AC91|nr:hypothetical protein [Halorussus salinus]